MTNQSRKRMLTIIFVTLLVLSGSAFAYKNYKDKNPSTIATNNTNSNNSPTNTPSTTPTPTSNLVASPLDGTIVSAADAARHPLAIMIENTPDARPAQTGLASASIVYETLAEGGITRFEAIYGPNVPKKAGPVRSARTYYVSWAKEYDAYYAHAGGAGDALGRIKAIKVKDINALRIGQPYFWREPRAGVASWHTMFTNPQKLYKYANGIKKWSKTATFPTWTFKDDAPITDRPDTGTITVNFSYGITYLGKWKYDATNNVYLRSTSNSVHRDAVTGKQISAKNVIIQYNKYVYKSGKKDHNLELIGTGKAQFFLDGKMTEGTWTKKDKYSRTMFFTKTGQPVQFNRGNTWIEVASPGHSKVSYTLPKTITTTPTPTTAQ